MEFERGESLAFVCTGNADNGAFLLVKRVTYCEMRICVDTVKVLVLFIASQLCVVSEGFFSSLPGLIEGVSQ